jgi:hypothetical protein
MFPVKIFCQILILVLLLFTLIVKDKTPAGFKVGRNKIKTLLCAVGTSLVSYRPTNLFAQHYILSFAPNGAKMNRYLFSTELLLLPEHFKFSTSL